MKKEIRLNNLSTEKIMTPQEMKSLTGGSNCKCCCSLYGWGGTCGSMFPVNSTYWEPAMQEANEICSSWGQNVMECYC